MSIICDSSNYGRHSRIRDLNFLHSYNPQWNPGTNYLLVLILGLLGHAAFYEDESRYEVCPYTDQRGDLSFVVCVKVKWVLCYFVIVSRPVAYVEYCKTSKNIMSDGRHLLLLTLNYTVALLGLATKQYCDGYGSPASNNLPLQSLLHNSIIETTTPPWVFYIIVRLPLQFLSC